MARDIVSHRSEARDRLRAQERQRQHARLADQAMPMALHYGPRPLLLIPLGELDARGRRAA